MDFEKTILEFKRIALIMHTIACGNTGTYNKNIIHVWYTGDNEPIITFDDKIIIVINTKYFTNISFEIRNISKINEVKELLTNCQKFIIDYGF